MVSRQNWSNAYYSFIFLLHNVNYSFIFLLHNVYYSFIFLYICIAKLYRKMTFASTQLKIPTRH